MLKNLFFVSLLFLSSTAFAEPFDLEVYSGQVCKSGPERVKQLARAIDAYPDKVIVYTEINRVGSDQEIVARAYVKKPVRIEDIVGTSDMVCARIVGQ